MDSGRLCQLIGLHGCCPRPFGSCGECPPGPDNHRAGECLCPGRELCLLYGAREEQLHLDFICQRYDHFRCRDQPGRGDVEYGRSGNGDSQLSECRRVLCSRPDPDDRQCNTETCSSHHYRTGGNLHSHPGDLYHGTRVCLLYLDNHRNSHFRRDLFRQLGDDLLSGSRIRKCECCL